MQIVNWWFVYKGGRAHLVSEGPIPRPKLGASQMRSFHLPTVAAKAASIAIAALLYLVAAIPVLAIAARIVA
jgi:hypothetical protein